MGSRSTFLAALATGGLAYGLISGKGGLKSAGVAVTGGLAIIGVAEIYKKLKQLQAEGTVPQLKDINDGDMKELAQLIFDKQEA